MKNLVWHNRYNIGVDIIDKEHKQLFSIIGKLLRIVENEEKGEWVCQEGVKYLKNHTLEHFQHEEEYMRSINYNEYDIHKRLHDNFQNKTLPALEQELKDTNYSIESIRHFLGVCIGWVVSHTQTEDQAISGKTNSKWAEIPHEEEIHVLEQVITQLIYDMFNLKTNVVSEHYGGEDFGKTFCLNFIYKGQEKEKWDITLIFEEQLLLYIVGSMMDTQYLKVDDMIINIIRYASRQFLDRIREIIPSVSLHEVERESLLTQDQLVNAFERSNPSCSLLFDTGEGYLAFCVTSSDSIRGKIAPEINAENAIDEINNYLIKNNNKNNKVLVVDDSDFMRARISQLLTEDYTVIEACSSVSAIKYVFLDRPDLILLDYEMPVCDGRQMLAMLRSEPDIADIPVIFLTARGDKESVKKVTSLKPEGYLLKIMGDEDIKKTIDAFFEKKNGKPNS